MSDINPSDMLHKPGTTLGRSGLQLDESSQLDIAITHLDGLLTFVHCCIGDEEGEGFQNLNDTVQATVLSLAASLAKEVHELHSTIERKRMAKSLARRFAATASPEAPEFMAAGIDAAVLLRGAIEQYDNEIAEKTGNTVTVAAQVSPVLETLLRESLNNPSAGFRYGFCAALVDWMAPYADTAVTPWKAAERVRESVAALAASAAQALGAHPSIAPTANTTAATATALESQP